MVKNLNTDFSLRNWLFESVKLTKNADLDKYKDSGCGIGFTSRSKFSFTDGTMGENVIILGADMSASADIDNKNKAILILGEGPTEELDNTTLTGEAKYPINFTQPNKRFVLSLHQNWRNSFLFVNATENISIQSKGLWN